MSEPGRMEAPGTPPREDLLNLYREKGCTDCDQDCAPGSIELVRCLLANLAGAPNVRSLRPDAVEGEQR